MNLKKKKDLAVQTLGVGKKRVVFNKEMLDQIKEAITKQDIRDLVKEKAIVVNEIKGRKKKLKRNTRRKEGSVKKKVNKRKERYMIITRKLRAHLAILKKKNVLHLEDYRKLRKEIRAKEFRSKAHMKEKINQMIKEREKI